MNVIFLAGFAFNYLKMRPNSLKLYLIIFISVKTLLFTIDFFDKRGTVYKLNIYSRLLTNSNYYIQSTIQFKQ